MDKVQIQSIYFSKTLMPLQEERGVATMPKELRFFVYENESFFTFISIINLDNKKSYEINVSFKDEKTNDILYEMEGKLDLVNRNQSPELQKGFIMAQNIDHLTHYPSSGVCKVAVKIKDNKNNEFYNQTNLLVIKGENPYE